MKYLSSRILEWGGYAFNFSSFLSMREAAFQYGTRENETLETDLKYLEILSVVLMFFLLTFCVEKLQTTEKLQE